MRRRGEIADMRLVSPDEALGYIVRRISEEVATRTSVDARTYGPQFLVCYEEGYDHVMLAMTEVEVNGPWDEKRAEGLVQIKMRNLDTSREKWLEDNKEKISGEA